MLPGDKVYDVVRRGSGKQEVATTMAFVRLLRELIKDGEIGARFVPIIPDEARTFGMDSMFPTQKIYNPNGQQYTSVDASLMLAYRESEEGQLLHEGINEAGSMGSFTAAGSSYATHGQPMIPVYVFYSMFGFQRTGDSIWAAADQMARGFLIGATAGRTTLTGEGLQHNDGHSLLLAATNPAIVSYDPAFSFEIAPHRPGRAAPHVRRGRRGGRARRRERHLLHDGLQRPVRAAGRAGGPGRRRRSCGASTGTRTARAARVRRCGCSRRGCPCRGRCRPATCSPSEFGVGAEVWSVTSWGELRRDGVEAEQHNLINPGQEPRVPFVTSVLGGTDTPVVAVSDWMRALPDLIRQWVPAPFTSLGTDGFGLSDTRPATRRHFNVDAQSITVAALAALGRAR